MNRNIKHIIALTLVINAFSAIISGENLVGNIGLGLISANAATYNGAGIGELKSLNVYRGSGSELELRSSYYGDEVDLSSKKDYYVELNSSDGIDIDAEVEGDGYVVKVFTSGAKDAKAYDIGDFINIDSTGNNVYLRTYKSEDDFKEAEDDGDVTNCKKTYVLHVKKVAGSASDEELFGDDATLKSIYLSDGTIDFSKNKTEYEVNVGVDIKELIVRAKPDNNSNTVEINGENVDEDDNYEYTVNLEKGDNVIEIKVTNDDEDYYNVYTLKVFRGKTSDENDNKINSNTINQIQATNWSFNSWQQENGKWKYINGIGQPLKDKWWFDINSNKTYYLDSDGYRKSGWLFDKNRWYYLNENGEMQTGWIELDGKWYYLNKAGAMTIGWNNDENNKWYYFDESGVMKTGWFQASNGNWYYFNEKGEMLSNTTIDGYDLDKNGVMI